MINIGPFSNIAGFIGNGTATGLVTVNGHAGITPFVNYDLTHKIYINPAQNSSRVLLSAASERFCPNFDPHCSPFSVFAPKAAK